MQLVRLVALYLIRNDFPAQAPSPPHMPPTALAHHSFGLGLIDWVDVDWVSNRSRPLHITLHYIYNTKTPLPCLFSAPSCTWQYANETACLFSAPSSGLYNIIIILITPVLPVFANSQLYMAICQRNSLPFFSRIPDRSYIIYSVRGCILTFNYWRPPL